MSAVHEIMAAGRYVDRRGREWLLDREVDVWAEVRFREGGITGLGYVIDPDQFRLWIERDQHRDVCPGLVSCAHHPVPVVIGGWPSKWELLRPWMVRTTARGRARVSVYDTHAEAIDAARRIGR